MADQADVPLPDIPDFLTTLYFQPHTTTELNSACEICRTLYNDDARHVVTLACNHKFHRICITKWLTHGIFDIATCPYCRRTLCTRYADSRNDEFSDEVLAVWVAEDDQEESGQEGDGQKEADREESEQAELRQQIAELEEQRRLFQLYIVHMGDDAVTEPEALG